MASIVPYSSGFGLSKVDRRVSRALAQIDGAALIASHRDRARLDWVSATTEYGMVRACQLGVLEAGLNQNAPYAAGYVHTVATAGVIGITSVVYDAGRGA
jgi:hypothetical protein